MSFFNLFIVLVSVAIGIPSAYLIYANRQLRRRIELHRRFYAKPIEVTDGISLSFYHIMKGGRIVVPSVQLFNVLGISEIEMLNLIPILLYFEGCVYAGDQETEAHYQDGIAAENSRWAYSMTQAATQLGIFDATLAKELNLLNAYYDSESSLMRREIPLTDKALYDINLARSHDVKFIIRAALGLLRRPVSEPLLNALQPWFALGEILDDLGSYEKDLRSGSFNTLSLLVQLHSPEHAVRALEKLCQELVNQIQLRFQQVAPQHIGRFLGFFLFRKYGTSVELLGLLSQLLPREVLLNWLMTEVRTLAAFHIRKLPPVLTLPVQ